MSVVGCKVNQTFEDEEVKVSELHVLFSFFLKIGTAETDSRHDAFKSRNNELHLMNRQGHSLTYWQRPTKLSSSKATIGLIIVAPYH